MGRSRVLIADDHEILVASLRVLLEPLCEVIGTVGDGRALIVKAKQLLPDVIVGDINMPELNGLEACERLRMEVPGAKMIFLTVNEDAATAEEAIRRGALGYVLKKDAANELFRAIRTVAMGGIYVSRHISREPISHFVSRAKSRVSTAPLTPRQREVLQLLAEGKSMKEAADILQVKTRTIAFHKYAIMEQLGITRNAELVLYATHSGICHGAGHL